MRVRSFSHHRLVITATVLTVTTFGVGRASAHEIGKTQASATIVPGGVYRVDVTVDPDALLTKLDVYGGRPLSTGLTREERDRQIEALGNIFLEHVSIWFGNERETPRFEYVRASAIGDFAQEPSVVRLTGRAPTGAQSFSFAYDLVLGSYALNVRIGNGPSQMVWLTGGQQSQALSLTALPPPPGWTDVARQYFGLGYRHILPQGIDHVLFVIGIFLLSARWRTILLQVSTFTIAHSITLGLTMYGVVSLPAKVVEPMIALSIAYVAIENLVTSDLKPWRMALVFCFGLLHGMGFAGVLRDLGLPRADFLTALVAFNGGVEAGQLSVIALAFAIVSYWQSDARRYQRYIVQPASLLIAAVGLWWSVQRALL
jgi:hydrogenase/urease accessory protein HupE